MAILNRLATTCLLLMLTACYEQFTPDINITPVLCVNSLITAGEPICVDVTHTQLYTDTSWNKPKVADAVIKIYANGELKDPSYLPAEGDTIKITVESATYGYAEAEVTVPVHPTIQNVEWTPTLQNYWHNEIPDYSMLADITFNILIKFQFSDPVDTRDYYHLTYSDFYNNGYDGDYDPDYNVSHPINSTTFWSGTFEYDSEPIFSEHIGTFESVMGSDSFGFTFFTDTQFSGEPYTLHLQFTNAIYRVNSIQYNPDLFDCGLTLTLSSVSESYYKWTKYLWQRENGYIGELGDIGLGDPLWAYSNVSTGAGIVAARTPQSYNINLKDYLEETFFSNKGSVNQPTR